MPVLSDVSATTAPNAIAIIVEVDVELDISTLPRFSAELDAALAARPARLVVNLTACPFLDAAAMGVLLDAHRATVPYGGELVLRGCSDRVLRLLSLTGLGRVFHFS